MSAEIEGWKLIDEIPKKEGMLIVGYNEENDPRTDVFVWEGKSFKSIDDDMDWSPPLTHGIVLPKLPKLPKQEFCPTCGKEIG